MTAALRLACSFVLLSFGSARARAEDDRAKALQAIAKAATADQRAYDRLAELTDRIGHRLSGSRELDRAIAWAIAGLQADAQENVRSEKVMVPHWVRGAESAELLVPFKRKLALLGLGGTIATPPSGITAEVIAVDSFEELAKRKADVPGKIVLFDRPMPEARNYGEVAALRGGGASEAAKYGAVGMLLRSAATRSLRSPHTGAMRYVDGIKKVPAAALAVEDAALISRLLARGEKVRLKLVLSGKSLGSAPSANVVAELVGRERPEQVVLIGAHLDSWDVGQGAHDDGAGVMMVIESLRILRGLGKAPRRTIRGVLFTNEENGLAGAIEYAKLHAADHHVAAIEADTGAFRPIGFRVQGHPDAIERLKKLGMMLPAGATRIEPSPYTGADISPLEPAGVALLGLSMEIATYFDYHHSDGDTLDKIDPVDLQNDVAVLASMAYLIAEEEQALPRKSPQPSQ